MNLRCFGGAGSAVALLVCVFAMLTTLPACGGGGGGRASDPPQPPPPLPPGTRLTCDGYPQPVVVSVNGTQQTYTKACLIVQEYAAVTPDVSITTKAGDVFANGGAISDAYIVYSRIIAQAADLGAATGLARSVVINTANGAIAGSPDQVDSPQALQIDFEIFTAASANVTMSSDAGNLWAENYSATLKLTAQAGKTSLTNVQGNVSVNTNAGAVDITLAGAAWVGPGMTATTQTGDISLTRPTNYSATFTAESGLGTASIDNLTATTVTPGMPATVTAGVGAPIVLKTRVGNVTVGVAQ